MKKHELKALVMASLLSSMIDDKDLFDSKNMSLESKIDSISNIADEVIKKAEQSPDLPEDGY